jgi:hypothetical protein
LSRRSASEGGGEGRGEGGLVAPQQSEGGRILSLFTYFSALLISAFQHFSFSAFSS